MVPAVLIAFTSLEGCRKAVALAGRQSAIRQHPESEGDFAHHSTDEQSADRGRNSMDANDIEQCGFYGSGASSIYRFPHSC
jgi:hypothetical protein